MLLDRTKAGRSCSTRAVTMLLVLATAPSTSSLQPPGYQPHTVIERRLDVALDVLHLPESQSAVWIDCYRRAEVGRKNDVQACW